MVSLVRQIFTWLIGTYICDIHACVLHVLCMLVPSYNIHNVISSYCTASCALWGKKYLLVLVLLDRQVDTCLSNKTRLYEYLLPHKARNCDCKAKLQLRQPILGVEYFIINDIVKNC